MKRLIVIIFFSLVSALSYGQKFHNIYTSDIDNFWNAYDSIKITTDTAKQLKFIQTLYLDKATDGLKDFIISRHHSAKLHLSNILKYPKFWNSLRPKTLEIKNHIADFEILIANFKTQYPKLKEPKIYFTIGVLNSGGTTSPGRILIGSEIACSDKTVDASELSKWLQGAFKLNSSVVSMVAHEIGHTQQKGGDSEDDGKSNLLGYCLGEGACDFITELIYKPVSSPYMNYGKLNETQLWTNFQEEMFGQETKNWLYNGDNAPNGVADLGYFIGYKICKAYYDNSKNKKEALRRIIRLNKDSKSAIKFLGDSNYKG